jgi:hypothetical protein
VKIHLRISAAAIALVSCLSACTSPAPSPGAPGSLASIKNSCINPTEIRKQTIVSDQEIQFELNNGDVWVNRLARACHGLKLSGGFSWEVRGTLACSNQERITVKDTGTPCQIGEFTHLPPTAS